MRENVLLKVIAKNGIKQLDIVQEELAELIQAISKFKRYNNKESELKVIEEAADVYIMLKQLKMLFNIPQQVIEDEIDIKLDKLEGYLEEEKS